MQPAGIPSTCLTIYSADHERFRRDVSSTLAAWQESAQNWEANGHLEREVFGDLGSRGFFRKRWETGRSGTPYGLVLAEEAAALSSGLGLAVTLHTEMFLGTVRRLARTPSQTLILESALDGTAVGCIAATEATGGSDLADVALAASFAGSTWLAP